MSLYDIKKRLEILELFKKSTSAMKLVSLSLHHQLKKIIPEYKEKFINNKLILQSYFDVAAINGEKVFIFISSDRGFCGDYVNTMFHQFEKIYNIHQDAVNYIIVGKMLIHKIQSMKYQSKKIIEITSFKIDKFDLLYQEIILICKEKNIKLMTAYYTESKNISIENQMNR